MPGKSFWVGCSFKAGCLRIVTFRRTKEQVREILSKKKPQEPHYFHNLLYENKLESRYQLRMFLKANGVPEKELERMLEEFDKECSECFDPSRYK